MTDLAISLLDWQKEVWNNDSRFKVVAAGRRTGKSRLAAYLLIVNALKADKGNVFYVAPTQGQARDIMWNLLLEIGSPVIKSSHINNQQIKLINGSTISLKGADRPETMRGISLFYVCLDELSEMKPEVWELILRPALADLKGSALFIGTPTGRNHFYSMYIYGQGDDPDWESWHFTSYDNKLIDKAEIDSAKKSMSSYAFRQEFMASFEARGSEMFKEEWVKFEEEEPKTGDYYIAVDLAGFAEAGKSKARDKRLDSTALAIVKVGEYGWWVKDIIHGRWDLNETAIKIFNAVRDYEPISVGIEKGIARQAVISPLSDLMRQYNRYFRVEELTHGNKSKTDRVMWALQGRFENGAIKLNKGSWNEVFLDEMFQFPDVLTHDDTIDALAYIDQLQTVSYQFEYEVDEHKFLDSVAGY
jgi:phage terminase large subunit-like protein